MFALDEQRLAGLRPSRVLLRARFVETAKCKGSIAEHPHCGPKFSLGRLEPSRSRRVLEPLEQGRTGCNQP
jgi:hypothetical protein